MKRYKLKLDSPWGKKGDEFKENTSGLLHVGEGLCDPSCYPDLFEEIQEIETLLMSPALTPGIVNMGECDGWSSCLSRRLSEKE